MSLEDVFLGKISLADFFWDHVNIGKKDDCWEWKAKRKRLAGYGHFGFGDRFLRAHRIALILSGQQLRDDQIVMHTCDNRACCNPTHLKVGTQKENMIDMRSKGRGSDPPIKRGEQNYSAILTTEQVIDIRNSSLRGVDLARLYGVAETTISSIKHRKIWKHV